MRKKNFKGRCEKKAVEKCKEVFKGYDAIQVAYVDLLAKRKDIIEIRSNIALDDSEYMTDFLCIKENGEMMVRECVFRKLLTRPSTIKLLDESRRYWLRRGISDWGVVLDEK